MLKSWHRRRVLFFHWCLLSSSQPDKGLHNKWWHFKNTTEVKCGSIIISQISQDAHKTHEEVNEEDPGQDTAQNLSSEEVSNVFFPEPNWEGAIDSTEQVHKTGPEDQVMVPFL